MAIKIAGTIVISDSKNTTNIVNGTYAGIVTAASFVGDGTNLTNVTTSGLDKKVYYTTPGTFVVGTDCPSSVTQIKISCMGGGGNGGGVPNSPTGGTRAGGGASVLAITYQSVSNGQSYSITVGGAAGISSVTLPSASPIDVISTPGGFTAPTGTGAGIGGTAAPISPPGSVYAFMVFNGGEGSWGDSYVLPPASPTVVPPAGFYYFGGKGGDSILGAAGDGNISSSPLPSSYYGVPTRGNGGAASGYGAGGGGASSAGIAPIVATTGGVGAPGIVIIEW